MMKVCVSSSGSSLQRMAAAGTACPCSSEHLGSWKGTQVVHLKPAILRPGRAGSGMAAFKYSSLLITAEPGPFNLWSLAAGPPGHTLNTKGCSP